MNLPSSIKINLEKKSLTFALSLLISFSSLSLFAEPQLTGSPSEIESFLTQKNFSVKLSAEAFETIKPNQAKMTLKISSSNAKLADAMQANQNLQSQIITNLNQSGISNQSILVARFASADNGSWVDSPNQYQVANRIEVTVVNEAQMLSVARVIDAFDQVSMLNLEFENASQDEFENEVRARAIEKVLQQKSLFEKRLGLTLRPIQFNHSPSYSAVNQPNSNSQAIDNPSGFDEKTYKSFIEVEFAIN